MNNKFFFLGPLQYLSFGKKLGDYLKMKTYHLENCNGCEIDYYDIIFPYFNMISNFVDKCQIVAMENYKKWLTWDNKLYQRDKLKDVTLIPNYYSVPNLNNLINRINKKVCITQTMGYGGINTLIYNPEKHDQDYINSNTDSFSKINPIIITDYIKKDKNISLNIVIFDDGYVFITSPVEQIIKNDVKFVGGKYPIELTRDLKDKIEVTSKEIGKVMYEDGYRGIAGIDFMSQGNILYFTEINARNIVNSFGLDKVVSYEYGMSLPVIQYKALFEDTPKLEKKKDYKKSWTIEKMIFKEYD